MFWVAVLLLASWDFLLSQFVFIRLASIPVSCWILSSVPLTNDLFKTIIFFHLLFICESVIENKSERSFFYDFKSSCQYRTLFCFLFAPVCENWTCAFTITYWFCRLDGIRTRNRALVLKKRSIFLYRIYEQAFSISLCVNYLRGEITWCKFNEALGIEENYSDAGRALQQ